MVFNGLTVLICGGRDYTDVERVYAFLDNIHKTRPIGLIVTGACKYGGADLLAENWARNREIDYLGVPAKWKTGGKKNAEGPIRNKLMIDLVNPEIVIGFPGGSGTAGMLRIAEKKGIWAVDLRKNPRMIVKKLMSL